MKNSYFWISWLRDNHTNTKLVIDWLIPISIALNYLAINLWLFNFNKSVIFFESNSFDKIIGLFQILPGFYIAALAAIVSIQPKETIHHKSEDSEDNTQLKTRINKLDDVKDSKLDGYINGKKRKLPIRLLLTRGLAHLAITSLLLIVFSTFTSYLIEVKFIDFFIKKLHDPSLFQILLILIDTLFIFFISQILSITCFLTKFLGDELNRV